MTTRVRTFIAELRPYIMNPNAAVIDAGEIYEAMAAVTFDDDMAMDQFYVRLENLNDLVCDNEANGVEDPVLEESLKVYERAMQDAFNIFMDKRMGQGLAVKLLKKRMIDVGRLEWRAQQAERNGLASENGLEKSPAPADRLEVTPGKDNGGEGDEDGDETLEQPPSARVEFPESEVEDEADPHSPRGRHDTPTPPPPRSRSRSVSPSGGFGSFSAPAKPAPKASRSRSVSPSGGFGSLSAAPKSSKPTVPTKAPKASSRKSLPTAGNSAAAFTPAPAPPPALKWKFELDIGRPQEASTSPVEEPAAPKLKSQPVHKRQPSWSPVEEPVRKKRRSAKKFKSEEVVIDSDNSDTGDIDEMPPKAEPDAEAATPPGTPKKMATRKSTRKSPAPKPIIKAPVTRAPAVKVPRDNAVSNVWDGPSYIDLSEGLAGFEYNDDEGKPVKRPHGREALVNGVRTETLIVKLKFPAEKLNALMEQLRFGKPQKKTSTGKKASFFKITESPPPSRPAAPPISDDDDGWEEVPPSHPRTSTPASFPPFPTLTTVQFSPFIQGIVIAVENLITDHELDQSLPMADILEDYEGEGAAATFSEDDRGWRPVLMRGRQYVYDAVHTLIDSDSSSTSSVGDDDEAKDSVLDADGDTAMPPSSPPPKKAHYKGPGRAWAKTTEDADPDFAAPKVEGLPARQSGVTRAAWTQLMEQFGDFRAHVKREYDFRVGVLGVAVQEDWMPSWLL